jgi:effector-binding domain-containing protein
MGREVKVARREAIPVLTKRLPVRLTEIGTVLSSAFGEIYGYLARLAVAPGGPPCVIYHDVPAVDHPFDVEICVPVARPLDPPAGWRFQELPAGLFATILHVGPYDTLGDAYAAVKEWIVGHELAVAGPPREVYLSEPGTPPEQVKTIVEFPVLAVATSAASV